MMLQITQFGLATQLDIQLFDPGPAYFIELVKTHQHGPALQASHQVAKAVHFIQHIGGFVAFKLLGFAFDQMQAVGSNQADVNLVFDHRMSSRLPVEGNVAGDILYAAGFFQVKTKGIGVHFQPAAVGRKAGVFIGKTQAVSIDFAQAGSFKAFQQFP